MVGEMDTLVKEILHLKNSPGTKAQEVWDTMKRPNVRIIGIEEGEDTQVKSTESIFNKIIEENFPNLKKEMPIKVQEAYRTPNRLNRRRKSFW